MFFLSLPSFIESVASNLLVDNCDRQAFHGRQADKALDISYTHVTYITVSISPKTPRQIYSNVGKKRSAKFKWSNEG